MNEELERKIVELYKNSDRTTEDVAQILSCSKTSVKRVAKKFGISKAIGFKKPKITKDVLLEEYVNKHRTIKSISLEYRLSKPYIGKLLNKYNIQKRKGTRKNVKNTNLNTLYVGFSNYNLTIINVNKEYNEVYYETKCTCGSINTYKHKNFIRKKSCGCLKRINGSNHHLWKGGNYIPLSYFIKLQNRSIDKGLEFNIDIDYIEKVLKDQNFKCAFSNVSISLDKNNKTASLDRIDSTKGYVIGNVQWVHKVINQMKWNLKEKDFISMCKLVAQNN